MKILQSVHSRRIDEAERQTGCKGMGNGSAVGNLVLQRRAADKPLWPLYWSNACCSHPRAGETVEDAARRRLREELGVNTTCGLSNISFGLPHRHGINAGFIQQSSHFDCLIGDITS